jgi:hypothetical protein
LEVMADFVPGFAFFLAKVSVQFFLYILIDIRLGYNRTKFCVD